MWPAVHQADAVGQRQRLVLVVGDEHDGRAGFAMQPLDLDLHRLPQLAVERAERFVHQDQRRPIDQAACQCDALLLPAGQLAREPAAESAEAHHVEHRGNFGLQRVRRQVAHLQRERDVLRDRQVREQRIVLKHDAHVAPMRRSVRLVLAVDEQPTRMLVRPGHR